MGLDISARSKLRKATPAENEMLRKCEEDGEGELPEGFHAFMQASNDENNMDQHDGLEQGHYYVVTAHSEQHRFRAGSYSGYNHWRDQLCFMALRMTAEQLWKTCEEKPAEVAGRPFVELINFSDCQGSIGPTVSAKLYKDFCDFEERAKAFGAKLGTEGHISKDWWFEKYCDWKRVFELGKDDGMVDFH